LGTSYFKLGLFDRDGRLRGLGRVFVRKDGLDGGGCEVPAARFWSLLRQALAQACTEAKAKPFDIVAMAYSSQANSFLMMDDRDEPLTPIILWPDGRVDEINPAVEQLWRRDDFLKTTGIGIGVSRFFCVAKIGWFQQNKPDIWIRATRIMTISDYLVFALTSRFAGDMGTASMLGLLDLPNGRWWDDALQLVGLKPGQLATPLKPGTVAGEIDREGARRLGLRAGIPLVVGGLDHHIAAIGAGAGQIADLSESTGTVLACLRLSQEYRPKVDRCVGAAAEGHFYQLAFGGNGAEALQWYQEQYAPDMSIGELVRLAESVPAGCDGLLAKPMVNQYERLDGFENISGSHGKGHYVRAILESTAESLRVLVHALCGETKPRRIVATGGGGQSELWVRIMADSLGIEFVTVDCQETACLGSAMLAAVAAKWFENLASVSSQWVSVKKIFAPAAD
jgi:sugar (pentulose or hexulose) kinase